MATSALRSCLPCALYREQFFRFHLYAVLISACYEVVQATDHCSRWIAPGIEVFTSRKKHACMRTFSCTLSAFASGILVSDAF